MDVVTADGGRFALGTVEAGATVGIIDFSRRVTDDFGVTTVVPRGFSRRLSVRLAVPSEDADGLQRRLADLRSTAARWIADERFAWLSPSGFYKDFDIDLAVPPLSFCTLTVEGLAESEVGPDTGGDPAPMGASTLRLLQPFTMTEAGLIASSVAEDDAPAWAAGTGYAVGAKVLRQHRVYEAVIANVGKDPVAGGAEWLDTGPTNRWAMFDQALGTVTAAQGELTVRIDVGAIQGVALLDVTGAAVRVVADGYDRTQAVTGGTVTFLDLGSKGRVTVTISGGGAVSVGTLLVGKLVGLGVTEASPTAGISDFSRKDVDDFGEVTIVRRGWAKRMTAKALIRTDALDLVGNRIAAVRAVPALWIGQDGLDSLTVYGFFKDFEIAVDGPLSKLSLSIEGLSAAAKVAPLVEWEGVGNSGGKKPTDNADKTADNVAKDTNAVGGVPAPAFIAKFEAIEQIEPIKTEISAIALVQVDHADELAILDTARIDIEASQRQLDRDAGKLSEATLRLLVEAGHTRRVMRDAGITVDPESGIVRFHALDQIENRTTKAEIELNAQKGQISQKASTDYVDEQIINAVLDPKQVADLEPILRRVASAEILVDGFAGLIQSKAETTEVTAIGGRVKTAEENIDAANTAITNRVEKTTFEGLEKTVQAIEQKLLIDGDTVGLTVTIRQARSVADDAAKGALQGLLAADAADRRQFDQVTQARQELTTRMDDGLRTEASNRLALSVEVASLRAYAVSETTALVKAGEVTARSIEALGASSKQYAAAIGELRTASVTAEGSIVGMRTTIRQVANQAGTSDEALLSALIAGDQASRARRDQLVQIQTETNTQLVANERASAVARETLLVRMGLAEAAIVETRRVLTTNNQALVERVSATEAVISDKETGLAATRARLVTEEEANVERGKATAKAIETLDVALNDPKTGLAITVAAIGKAQETLIEDGKTTAKSIETINTSLNDPKTGLSVTVAAIGKAQETLVEDGKTTAKSIETINTTLNDPKTGLAVSMAAIGKSQETLVEDGKATAKSIESLTTKLGDLGEATVQDLIEAIVADTGLIKATRTLAIDINGNLVGTQLVGAKEGAGTIALINADLSMGTGRVIFDTGTVMKVQGLGFGVNKDLVTWFGPTMPIDKCSRSNGRVWEGTDGKGYWGAGLSVGVLHVARQTPDLAADASIVIGPFNTKGGSKVLVVSYAYELTRASTNKGSVTGKPTATIHLDRLDGESWALVQSFDVTGTTEYAPPSVDGDGYGRQTMGGAITFTDTKAGLGDFTYRARITARALASFNFNSPDSGREVQALSLSSTEE